MNKQDAVMTQDRKGFIKAITWYFCIRAGLKNERAKGRLIIWCFFRPMFF